MSLALYRKHRSATFADLIGQAHIGTTLRNQVRSGEVAHAYLFTGIRGTGKTSAARILARAVTCLDPRDGEPDNTCTACLEVLGGAAVDVLEIDAASNRGIDEMRELREKVRFLPASLRRKVYIVDEAHMLTPEAWNAFLKTLEEPPPHVLFVLATTEPHKVPETVRSRVQRFDFRRVPTEDIAAHLARICDLEGAAADPDALRLVAQAGQGSVRDALSILDQALATGERPLHESTVRRALGLADPATLRALMLGVAGGDAATALRSAAAAFDAGADARQLLREIARLARGAELTALGFPEGAELSGVDAEVCAELAGAGRRGVWVDVIDRCAEAEINLRQPVDSRLQVELALLRLTEGERLGDRLSRLEEALAGDVQRAAVPAGRGAPPPASPPPAPPESPIPRLAVPRPPRPAPPADAPGASPEPPFAAPGPPPPAPPVPASAPPETGGAPGALQAWLDAWPAVIETVNRRDVMLAGILRSCAPVGGDGERLVIGVPFGWHLERVRDPQKAPLLAEAVAAVTGRPCAVEAEFVDHDQDASARGAGRERQQAPAAAGEDGQDATSALLAAFPGARLTGSVLRDGRPQ